MARTKSEFVGAFGTAFEVFKGLTDEVMSLGGGDDDLRRILKDARLRRSLAELIVVRDVPQHAAFPIVVNYDLTLSTMIAAGRYDWVNGDITRKNFLQHRLSDRDVFEVETELVHLNRFISTGEVLQELSRLGYRPATLEELLVFGAAFPGVQRDFPVVALGSVWAHRGGSRDVPYLWGRSEKRGLGLFWTVNDWGDDYRFLAVRK